MGLYTSIFDKIDKIGIIHNKSVIQNYKVT